MSSTGRVYTIQASEGAGMTHWAVSGSQNRKGNGALMSMKGTNQAPVTAFRVQVNLP